MSIRSTVNAESGEERESSERGSDFGMGAAGKEGRRMLRGLESIRDKGYPLRLGRELGLEVQY